MASQLVSPRQSVPLFLTISRSSTGGIPGLSPTVEVRRTSDGSYLDFADSTFKVAGWTTKQGALVDLGGGCYQRTLDLAAIGAVVKDVLVAIFHVDNGDDVMGVTNDTYVVEDLETMRQLVTNRLEESPGNPGQLVLYEDDGVTVRSTWPIRDVVGGAVVASVGNPARRGPRT